MFLYLPSEAAKSKLVKLETSRTVKLPPPGPPTVSFLCTNLTELEICFNFPDFNRSIVASCHLKWSKRVPFFGSKHERKSLALFSVMQLFGNRYPRLATKFQVNFKFFHSLLSFVTFALFSHNHSISISTLLQAKPSQFSLEIFAQNLSLSRSLSHTFSVYLYKNGPSPASFSLIFIFSNTQYHFFNK